MGLISSSPASIFPNPEQRFQRLIACEQLSFLKELAVRQKVEPGKPFRYISKKWVSGLREICE